MPISTIKELDLISLLENDRDKRSTWIQKMTLNSTVN